jgi:DNA-binding transcriptional ArsR family regulator
MAAETELDPVIHAPARLRVLVTLAILRDGDSLSFTRLQELLGLTPGNLIIHLRKLEDAGYVTTVKTGSGVTARTSVSLSQQGRPEQLHSSPAAAGGHHIKIAKIAANTGHSSRRLRAFCRCERRIGARACNYARIRCSTLDLSGSVVLRVWIGVSMRSPWRAQWSI